MHWFLDPVKNKFADFSGRATRQEYWMFVLVYVLLYIAVAVVATIIGIEALALLFSLIVLVPGLAITARRLHDTGMSGWWQLIGLIPFIGLIIMIVLLARKSDAGANDYGPNPHNETAMAAPSEAAAATPVAPVATEETNQ